MADADASTMDVSGLLAPWMQQSPWDMSQYGGAGQFGAAMLAGAGPTPYRVPFGVALGKAMQSGQQTALENAKSRMGLGLNSLSLQRQMALWPMIQRMLGRMSGMGTPGAPGAPGAAATPNAPAAPAASVGGGSTASPDASPAAAVSGATSAPSAEATPPGRSPAPWAQNDQIDPLQESRFGAVLSAAGVPNEFGKDASLQLQYDPGRATAMEAAKSGPAQDLWMYSRALEASGGKMSPAAQAFLNKFKTDTGMFHIGSMSGISTVVEPDGSVTTYNPSTGLKVNSRTGAQYMPGALNAFAAREKAERSAALSAETSPAGGGGGVGGGGASPAAAPAPARRGAPAAAAPTAQLTGAAAFNTENYIPPILQGTNSTIPQRPGNTSYASLQAMQKGLAADAVKTNEELQERASEGQTLLAQTAQIRASAAEYPWTGRFADDRATFLNLLQGAGLLSPQQTKELSSYQDAAKISIQLQASATRQLGSREAAQVFSVMGKSIPNLTISPDGLDKVSAYMEGIARYNQAMSQYSQRLAAQGNVAGVNGVENAFVANSNPTFFIMASASQKTQQEFLAMMPAPKRAAFIKAWDKAITSGLAPRPLDYQEQGQ